MGAGLSALRKYAPEIQCFALQYDSRKCNTEIDGVRYYSFYGERNGRLSVSACKQAKRVVDIVAPDIIHILGTEGVFCNIPDWVVGEVPVVVSLQGIMSSICTHYSGGIRDEELRAAHWNVSTLRGFTLRRTRQMIADLKAKSEQDIFSRNKYFIGRTRWDRAWLSYFHPSAKYYHVDEILRDTFYKVAPYGGRARNHVIYCGGAAGYPLKGAHWAIRAVAALKKDFPDIELRIADAGYLKSKLSVGEILRIGYYGLYLRSLIRKLQVEKNVIALPSLDASRVAEELLQANAYLLPSTCENSPNSLAEAMLIGTPAIAAYAGGTSSLMKDGVEGQLVPIADPASIAYAIRKVFDCPDYAAKMAFEGRQTALIRHDPQRNTEALVSAYFSVLESRSVGA